jgi:phage-related minor tail protein
MTKMQDIDRLSDFSEDVSDLERSLDSARQVTGSFSTELRDLRITLTETVRDLGSVERGFSSGLRRAFDGLVLDGLKLSDALSVVATSMADTVYSAAVNPVTDHAGGLLADGLNSLISGLMPYADGASFSQGRVMPFARGGVVTSPTTFPMRGGTGLMGEAGAEAIMPLSRSADGRLGVAAQGGANVNVTMNISTQDARSFERSQGQIAAQVSRLLNRGQRNR